MSLGHFFAAFFRFRSSRRQIVSEPSGLRFPLIGDSDHLADANDDTMQPDQRANRMFERLLTPQQRSEWHRKCQVTVPLSNGKYAIIGSSRIRWWDRSEPQCVLPDSMIFRQVSGPYNPEVSVMLPNTDILIAQLLHLRNDPDHLRKIGRLPSINATSTALSATFNRMRHSA